MKRLKKRQFPKDVERFLHGSTPTTGTHQREKEYERNYRYIHNGVVFKRVIGLDGKQHFVRADV